MYKGFDLFEMGDGKIIQSLKHIREALQAEENLVADDDVETFREQIGRSINDKMIKALEKYAVMAKKKSIAQTEQSQEESKQPEEFTDDQG